MEERGGWRGETVNKAGVVKVKYALYVFFVRFLCENIEFFVHFIGKIRFFALFCVENGAFCVLFFKKINKKLLRRQFFEK